MKKDIVEHPYVKRGSKAWYKLRNWHCIPCPADKIKPGYDTFTIVVESQLKIIRELELTKLEVLRLKLIVCEKKARRKKMDKNSKAFWAWYFKPSKIYKMLQKRKNKRG